MRRVVRPRVFQCHIGRQRRSVFIEIEGIQPVMQMEIAYDLETVDAEELVDKVHNTIHNLRPAFKGK